ncbi:hypothetical protein H1C71_031738 [Ictidomys tridecemlineatus]|nr:hypothetical protein H1C71_031738 [Ictidomys tridecemlineatus]
MATNYSANQYEKAFSPKILQNWSPAKPTKEHPFLVFSKLPVLNSPDSSSSSSDISSLYCTNKHFSLPPLPQKISSHEGYTQIIANDRGHLLPSVPRSKVSPWGTFMGTWQMPQKIPPARVTLTSRTTAGAASLTEWIQKNPDLLKACNGLRPEILGKPNDPESQKKLRKKSITKTVQQVPSPTIIPNFIATNPNPPDQPHSPHPSAGHTPGPQSPVNSPGPQSPVNSLNSPPRSAGVLEH